MKIINANPVDNIDFVAEVTTYMGSDSLRVFAWGFLEMAEMSSERAVQNRCAIDAVIPALLYSLRHSVELFLKYILYDLRAVHESKPVKGHSIKRLFDEYNTQLTMAFESEPNNGFHWHKWMRQFECLVLAIDELDPDGQSIRYPHNIKLIANTSGGYAISTKHLACCLAQVRSLYQKYDERSC